MTFKEALTSWLKTQAPLVALLWDDALADVRVFPLRKPQGTAFPQLTWHETGGGRITAIDGPIGLARATLTLECRDVTLEGADALAEAVRQLLPFGPDYMGLVFVRAFLLDPDAARADDEDAPAHAEEAGTALVPVNAKIIWEEP